jgi:phospholipid/cholesterol/gamma-HCH transport system ATP-binding protein
MDVLPMIVMNNISKSFGSHQVLDEMSLAIQRGETLAIVGPSGTGKSVTLKHMLGMLTPDSGEVIIDGFNITKAKARQASVVRTKFGVLFQSGALINWLSIADNVALPLIEKTRMKDKEIKKRVEEVLEMVELTGSGHKFPSEISGGMKKRAGLARAIVLKPEIILYDEPTSGLDPILSRKVDRLIKRLSHTLEVTSVVVTHDMVSAFGIADRIAMLDKGKVVAIGTPQEIRNNSCPALQELITAQFSYNL